MLSDGAATYTPGISERRGTTSTYQLNGLKNTFAQSDANGGHVSSRNYDAFGAVTSSSGTHQGPFGYGGVFGYQTDPDTGLMLLGHRFYDPSVGRFLTRDPVKDGRNWYGYGGGYANPANSVDPDGLLADWLSSVRTPAGNATVVNIWRTYAELSKQSLYRYMLENGTRFHFHHVFPRALGSQWERLFGKDWKRYIDGLQLKIPEEFHKWLHHGGNGGWWNAQWRRFFEENPRASTADAIKFLRRLLDKVGLEDVSLRRDLVSPGR